MMYNVVKCSLIVQLREEFKVANMNIVNIELSSEQNEFIDKALS